MHVIGSIRKRIFHNAVVSLMNALQIRSRLNYNNIFSSPLFSKCYVDSLDKQIADIVVSIAEYLYRDKRNIELDRM